MITRSFPIRRVEKDQRKEETPDFVEITLDL